MRRRIRSAAFPVHRHAVPQVALDAGLVALSYFLAYRLRFDGGVPSRYEDLFNRTITFAICGSVFIFAVIGLYRHWMKMKFAPRLRSSAAISTSCRRWFQRKNMVAFRFTSWRGRERWSSASHASFMFIGTASTGSPCPKSTSAFSAAKVFMSERTCTISVKSWGVALI